MSAARRVAGLAKYLSRLGYRVTVLTSMLSGSGPVEGAHRVVRTRDLMTSRLNWRRGSFQSLSGQVGVAYESRPSRVASVIVPDVELIGWLPFALFRALGLAASADCVITSSPPRSVHLAGLASRARAVPWIADFRDGWRFDDARPGYPAAAQDQLDALLERTLVRRADAVTAVSAPIAEDLRERLGVDAETITNGFDPDELGTTDLDGWQPPVAPDRHSLVYTGSLAYAGRTPEPLLAGIRQLRRDAPELAERLEVVFAGPLSGAEREAIEQDDLDGITRALGSLPRERALALQSAADSLLLIADDRRTSMATGKLYEYLAAAKPILVLGVGTAAARTVSEAGAGIVVSSDDPVRIAGALRELLDAAATRADASAVQRFSYAELARDMAAVVERVCESRSRAGGKALEA